MVYVMFSSLLLTLRLLVVTSVTNVCKIHLSAIRESENAYILYIFLVHLQLTKNHTMRIYTK